MLPRVDATGTGPVVRIEATPVAARATDVRYETAARFDRIAIGTAFQAEVLAHLADNGFLVRVGDADLHMLLPQGAQPGDRLQLTLAATVPRPTFLMALPTAEAATVLSPAGRLIDQILHSLPDDAANTPLRGVESLVATPDAGTARLAAALQGSLAESGLFYESHVALWAEGAWPMSALLKEPQAQAGRFLLTSTTPNATQDLSGALSGADHGSAAPFLMLDVARNSASEAVTSEAASRLANGGGPDLAGMVAANAAAGLDSASQTATFDAATARLIGQQLGVLEQGQVRWQGECWPGQRIDWQVQEDSAENRGTQPQAQRGWDSTLRLELPRLGKVSASIHLSGTSLRMQLHVANPAAVQELRQGGAALADAVAASGARLDQLVVSEAAMDKPQ